MYFLDLFAGIGGFRLGLEQAGNSIVVSVQEAIVKQIYQKELIK